MWSLSAKVQTGIYLDVDVMQGFSLSAKNGQNSLTPRHLIHRCFPAADRVEGGGGGGALNRRGRG